jgi:AcrR family transcriptional regulator
MRAARGQSREAIWSAAAELFAEQGYANTPVRDIAARAGVDPALVIRHFGSKEQLFLDTMQLATGEVLRLDAPLEILGEEIVRFVLGTNGRVRDIYIALVRASDTGGVASALRSLHEDAFVSPLLQRLQGDDRELRARLAAAMVGGLMYSLWTVEDAALLATDADAIVAAYAPALQVLITPV